MSAKVILVGGFLGAGKTTLLWKASQRIKERGLSVGLITNDQAPELVDSALLSAGGLQVSEVSGSCFCCNFNGFINAVKDFGIDKKTDIIIAEPVGSCTDLSATIMQPLKQYWSQKIDIAPLTVMSDPEKLESILSGNNAGMHEDAAYIFREQLQESDIILINKCDLLPTENINILKNKTTEMYPLSTVMVISAATGEGVDLWIDEVMKLNSCDAGKNITEIDYDKYANGEAVLGWLNGTIFIKGENLNCNNIIRSFMTQISQRLDVENLAVGHIKTIIESGNKNIISNLTGSETLSFRGEIEMVDEFRMTINARAETSPEYLNEIIRQILNEVLGSTISRKEIAWKYLQPGRPSPTYRYDSVFKLV